MKGGMVFLQAGLQLGEPCRGVDLVNKDIAALAGFLDRGARNCISRQYNRPAAGLNGVAESLWPRAMPHSDSPHRDAGVAIYRSGGDFVHVDAQARRVLLLQSVSANVYIFAKCQLDVPSWQPCLSGRTPPEPPGGHLLMKSELRPRTPTYGRNAGALQRAWSNWTLPGRGCDTARRPLRRDGPRLRPHQKGKPVRRPQWQPPGRN